MARLSKPAMNNVVIVAMLLMIALFNLDSFLPHSNTPVSQTLLPNDAYVLKIEHDNNALERSGQQWRQVSTATELPMPEVQYTNWQRGILLPVVDPSEDLTAITPFIVVIWMAGSVEGLVYAFYPIEGATIVRHNNQWYTLENVALIHLLPWISRNA